MADDRKNFSDRVRSTRDTNKRELDDWLQGRGATVCAVMVILIVGYFILTQVGII